jgi:hypothetical protein
MMNRSRKIVTAVAVAGATFAGSVPSGQNLVATMEVKRGSQVHSCVGRVANM